MARAAWFVFGVGVATFIFVTANYLFLIGASVPLLFFIVTAGLLFAGLILKSWYCRTTALVLIVLCAIMALNNPDPRDAHRRYEMERWQEKPAPSVK